MTFMTWRNDCWRKGRMANRYTCLFVQHIRHLPMAERHQPNSLSSFPLHARSSLNAAELRIMTSFLQMSRQSIVPCGSIVTICARGTRNKGHLFISISILYFNSHRAIQFLLSFMLSMSLMPGLQGFLLRGVYLASYIKKSTYPSLKHVIRIPCNYFIF